MTILDNYKTANINDLIALTHILDKYEEFVIRCRLFLENNSKEKITNLNELIYGDKKLASKEVKMFYKENIKTIQMINKYTNVIGFIYRNHFSNKGIEQYNNFFYYIKKVLLKNEIEKNQEELQIIQKELINIKEKYIVDQKNNFKRTTTIK